jgi:hypothetical protein
MPKRPALTAPRYDADGVCLAIPRSEFDRLCALFAPQLKLEGCGDPNLGALDPQRMLMALGGRESDFGADLKPRFEPSWFINGLLWKHDFEVQAFISRNKRAGACSYGPLQVMAFNAAGHGFTVEELQKDPEAGMGAAVAYFNAYVVGRWKCKALDEICRTWNGGHPTAATEPGYYAEVLHNYRKETVALLPAVDVAATSPQLQELS